MERYNGQLRVAIEDPESGCYLVAGLKAAGM
jgi:hypothetical protein